MRELSKMEIAAIVTHLKKGKPLPNEYRSIIFESDEGNSDDFYEELNKQALQKDSGELSFGRLIGNSLKMKTVFNIMQRVANKDVPVLIQGEKGTGKKIVAETIYKISSRSEGPFIIIDCGSLSEHDVDNKVFGGREQTFSKVKAERRGLIELAQGGTIFFNQIEELALPLQVKLLSFFRDKAIQNLNSIAPIPINARIIASTNIDLKQAVEEGEFRSDVLFHINGMSILIPPLRERNEDILPLADAFLVRYSKEYSIELTGFTDDARNAMIAYSWPGNVLELEYCIRNAVVMAEGRRLTRLDLNIEFENQKRRPIGLKYAKDELEKKMILGALKRHKNMLAKVSRELGISRPLFTTL